MKHNQAELINENVNVNVNLGRETTLQRGRRLAC